MLRVVGAGLGRTGTTSLKLALEHLLGGRCFHMSEITHESASAWADAYAGDLPDWHGVFDAYIACTDWPAAPFWPEISAAYPDALILLSIRDPDEWWRSASSTIFERIGVILAQVNPIHPYAEMDRRMLGRLTADWRDEESAKAAFVAYNDWVRATAPTDRLLEWRVGDGWEPLCERLELAVPQLPFPETNSTKDFRRTHGLDAALN
jgi:hypothetical protein